MCGRSQTLHGQLAVEDPKVQVLTGTVLLLLRWTPTPWQVWDTEVQVLTGAVPLTPWQAWQVWQNSIQRQRWCVALAPVVSSHGSIDAFAAQPVGSLRVNQQVSNHTAPSSDTPNGWLVGRV